MAGAMCIWAGGTNVPIQVAMRYDGTVFKRYKARDQYGFNWTKWKKTARKTLTPDYTPEPCISTGVAILSLLRPSSKKPVPKVQLPND